MTSDRVAKPIDTEPAHSVATQLLDLVAVVLRELHPGDQHRRAPDLDDQFDRDLGLDSLARVELIARIEAEFEANLPEAVIGTAETPRDLLVVLLKRSGNSSAARSIKKVNRSEHTAGAKPERAETLGEMLRWHAEAHGERAHIRLFDDFTDGEIISYQRLWDEACALAGSLQHAGLEPGDAVAIMLPTSRHYFFSFFAIVLAGAVPVPVYPPLKRSQLEDHLRRQSSILRNCRARFLIISADAKGPAHLLTAQVSSLQRVFSVDDLRRDDHAVEVVTSAATDTGFLQYTSGSTGDPKGVVLSHANLLANVRANGNAMRASAQDVFVSWLPLYHDMGLIGAWLGSLYHGPKLVVMSPLTFLARPERWLWAIHRYGGTLSAAPNFAFELCVRRIDDRAIEGLDLSTWRAAANGAEAINPATMAGFCDRFAKFGFARDAMLPVYGLAECSVGLTFTPLESGYWIDRIDREALALGGRAEAIDDEVAQQTPDTALELVSCGLPLPGHEIRIVDESGRELPQCREGQLQFRGPSATTGYFENPEKTASLITDGWLASGDRAYLNRGELFITGRSKDLIIRAGRNIYPSELEHEIGELDGIRQGCVAAFGSPDPGTGTERLVVVAETRRQGVEQRAHLIDAINKLALEIVGVPPDEVVLTKPNSVLKTSSGKIRRADTQKRFETNQLEQTEKALWLQVLRLGSSAIVPQAQRIGRRVLIDAYAGYVWILFGVFAIAAWSVAMLPLPKRVVWRFVRTIVRTLLRLCALPLDVAGELPPEGEACVIVANHQSYLDGPLLLAVLDRPVQFVVKAELETHWYLRIPLRHLGVRFIERFDHEVGVRQIREAAENAQELPLLIFPEGTFKRMPGLLPFHMGAFTTAVAAGIPVVALAIRGSRSVLRAGSMFVRRGAISINVGPAIAAQSNASSWQAALGLRDAARERLLSYCGEPDLGHESNAVDT